MSTKSICHYLWQLFVNLKLFQNKSIFFKKVHFGNEKEWCTYRCCSHKMSWFIGLHLYELSKGGKLQTQNKLMVAKDWEEWRMNSNTYWNQGFWREENLLKLWQWLQNREYTKNHQIVILSRWIIWCINYICE